MAHYCIFTTFYLPNYGGVEKYTSNLAGALYDAGQKVVIVTSALHNDAGISDEKGITVVRIPSVILGNNRFAMPRHCKELDTLLRWLDNQPIDYILVQQRFYPLSIFGLKYAEKRGIPAITLDHGSAHLTMSNPILDFFIECYEHFITGVGKRYASRYFAVSEKSAEWLGHFGIMPSGLLHNAIDADDFKAKASCRDFRKDLKKEPNDFHIVFTGRLIPEKGALILCDAVSELRNRGCHDIRLTIAGSGPLEDEIVARSSDAIDFVGLLDEGDISALLASADIFCFPTSYPEGLPTSLLEAAAYGLGLIVTDTGGARELIPDDSFGIVLDDCSVGHVADALYRFIRDPEYLASCGKKVAMRVRKLFSWDQTAKNLIEAFSNASALSDST